MTTSFHLGWVGARKIKPSRNVYNNLYLIGVSFTLRQDSPKGSGFQSLPGDAGTPVFSVSFRHHILKPDGLDQRSAGGIAWWNVVAKFDWQMTIKMLFKLQSSAVESTEPSWRFPFFFLFKIIFCFYFILLSSFSLAREVFLCCSCCSRSWTLAVSPLQCLGDVTVPTTECLLWPLVSHNREVQSGQGVFIFVAVHIVTNGIYGFQTVHWSEYESHYSSSL